MKSRYVSLRKNPAGSPENKKISYPGKGTRFGKHLFITCLKIEYTLCFPTDQISRLSQKDCEIQSIVGTILFQSCVSKIVYSLLLRYKTALI